MDQRRARVHDGPGGGTDIMHDGTSPACGRLGSRVLAGDSRDRRGGRGKAGGRLTGARAVTEKRHDGRRSSTYGC
jgi:hypothetical protein